MARRSGRGSTPERVVDLLIEAVAQSSQKNMANALGIGVAAVNRYLKGEGEPTQETLEKLAKYFQTSVAYLRGEPWALRDGSHDIKGMLGEIFDFTIVPEQKAGVIPGYEDVTAEYGKFVIYERLLRMGIENYNEVKDDDSLLKEIFGAAQDVIELHIEMPEGINKRKLQVLFRMAVSFLHLRAKL